MSACFFSLLSRPASLPPVQAHSLIFLSVEASAHASAQAQLFLPASGLAAEAASAPPFPLSPTAQACLSAASSSWCRRRSGLHRRAECPCPSCLRTRPRAPRHHVTALSCHPHRSAPIKSRASMSPHLKPRRRCGALAPP